MKIKQSIRSEALLLSASGRQSESNSCTRRNLTVGVVRDDWDAIAVQCGGGRVNGRPLGCGNGVRFGGLILGQKSPSVLDGTDRLVGFDDCHTADGRNERGRNGAVGP